VKKIALIVVFLMIAKPVFPLVDYAVNYDYITTVLCENKAKPTLQCNGKCHLMKELAKASANDDKPFSSDKKQSSNTLNDLFVENLFSFSFQTAQETTKNVCNDSYNNLYAHLNLDSIFHPPIFNS
jgi:hypothetical protein